MTLDDRFDEVSEAIAEQRDYTTACFDKARRHLKATENRLTRRLERHELLLREILQEVRACR